MDIAYLTSLLLFAMSVTITPGPNNLMLTASGLNFGFTRTLPHLLGVVFGFQVLLLMVALGLGALFSQWPILHSVMKVIGAVYLLFLAFKIARSGQIGHQSVNGKPMTFWQAAMFQFVNPKAWSMCITGVSAFTLTEEWLLLSMVAVAAAFMLAGFVCCSIWAALGSQIKNWLKSARQIQYFNFTLAALTAASVLLIIS